MKKVILLTAMLLVVFSNSYAQSTTSKAVVKEKQKSVAKAKATRVTAPSNLKSKDRLAVKSLSAKHPKKINSKVQAKAKQQAKLYALQAKKRAKDIQLKMQEAAKSSTKNSIIRTDKKSLAGKQNFTSQKSKFADVNRGRSHGYVPRPVIHNTNGTNSVVFTEDFESVPVTGSPAYTTVLPAGWVAVDQNGSELGTLPPISTFGAYQIETNRPPGSSHSSGTKAAMYQYNSLLPGDDYLFSPSFAATAGANYKLTFYYHSAYTSGNPYSETFRVVVASDTIVASILSEIQATTDPIEDTSWVEKVVEFQAPASGNLRIAFHANSPADNDRLYIDDVTLESLAPPQPNDLAVTNFSPKLAIATVSTPFKVYFSNVGTNSASGYSVGWSLDGVLQTTTSPAGTLAAGAKDSATFTWASPVVGSRTVKAWVNFPGDTAPANDTLTSLVTVLPDKDLAAFSTNLPSQIPTNTNFNLEFQFKNLGAAQSGFTVSYQVDGGTPVSQTYEGSLATNATGTLTFTTPINLSVGGNHEVKAYTALAGDANAENNSITKTVFLVGPVAPPYAQNFDGETPPTLPAGWAQENTNEDDYSWGSLADATVGHSAPNSASIRYNTNLAMDDWLFTPPLQFSAEKTYKVSFKYRARSASFPEKLEVKVGNAASSASMTGAAYFNNDNIVTTTYTQVEFLYSAASAGNFYIGFHGYSDVDEWNLYVDDFEVTEAAATDIAVTSVSVPVSIPVGLPTTVVATVKNNSSQPKTGIDVKYRVNGGTAVGPQTIASLAAGESVQVQFTGASAFTPASAGTYTVQAFSAYAGDSNQANDTASTTTTAVAPVTTYPYNQGFEAMAVGTDFSEGWSEETLAGTETDWFVINDGENPVVAPHSGAQQARFNSYDALSGSTRLLSPSFNMSGLSGAVSLSFWFYMNDGFSTADELNVQLSTDGGATFTSLASYTPDGTNAWQRKSLDLASAVGQSNVRIAFDGVSDFGYDVLLDDIKIGSPTSDASVGKIFALGKTPTPYGNPNVVLSEVQNNGISGDAISTTLTVKDAATGSVRYTETKNVNGLDAGASQQVTWDGWSPATTGTDSVFVSVSVAGDSNPSDNSTAFVQEVTPDRYNHSPLGSVEADGVGVSSNTADLVAKFHTNQAASINQLKVKFFTDGEPFTVGIWEASEGQPGARVYTSEQYTTSSSDYMTLDVFQPVGAGDFYVGVSQLGTTNFACGFVDAPLLPQTFFGGIPSESGTWTDLSTLSSRFLLTLEPVIGVPPQVDVAVTGMTLPTGDVKAGVVYPITMVVKNNGSQAVAAGYPVSYSAGGSGATVNAGPALAAGETASYTFTGGDAWTPSSEGAYSVTCTATVPGDNSLGNNSKTTSGIYLFPKYSVLYTGFNNAEEFSQNGTGLNVPADWYVLNEDGGGTTGPWFVHTPGAASLANFEGAQSLADNYQSANGTTIDDWLITPAVTRNADHTDSVSFYLNSAGGQWVDSLEVLVSPTAGTTAADFTTSLAYFEVPSGGWTKFTFPVSANLPGGATSYRVALRYYHLDGGDGSSSNYFVLDGFSVTSTPPLSTNPGEKKIPTKFGLAQNYPNPFNPTTTIKYDVAKAGRITLDLYNMLGQKVASLVDANLTPGTYQANVNATNLASGVYFYRMTASNGEFMKTMKMTLLK